MLLEFVHVHKMEGIPRLVIVRISEDQLARDSKRVDAFLDHGYEITQVSQLHSHSMPERYAPQLTKSFSRALRKPTLAAMEAG